MRVVVFAMSHPNWDKIEDFFKDEIGVKPVSSLASTSIRKESPLAYPAILNHKLTPMLSVDEVDYGFKHGSLTVAVSLDSKNTIIDILTHKEFQVMKLTSLCFAVTASYYDWHRIILDSLRGDDSEFHEFLSHVLLLFDLHGFRLMFSKYQRTKIADDVFALC